MPPKAARVPSVGASRNSLILWWGLLIAPCLAIVLTLGLSALHELGYSVREGVRETLVATSARWVGALARAAFLYPSAWLLERVVHRLRPHSERSPLLALPITVVGIYVLGATELLEEFGHLGREDPLAKAVHIATGAIMVALVPLLLVWAVVAFRQRRR